jgi:ABC-type lipoprotein export system ATPase subunit
MSVLLDLNARGQTVLLVTHNPDNAALAGRVLHLRDGRPLNESAGLFTRAATAEGYDRALITEEL